MTTIAHLVDDTTPGGVMRVIEHIQRDADMARLAHHRIIPLPRSGWAVPRVEADLIVSHLSLNWRRLPWLMQLRAIHSGTPMVHVEHSYTAAFARHNVARMGRFSTMLRISFSLFERIVAVSEAQATWMVEKGLADAEQIEVIASAIDVAPFLALHPIQKAPRVIGAFGRLEPQKGFDTLIAAMRACPRQDLELRLFGDGGEREALVALAAGDPRIRFMGHVSDPARAMGEVEAVAMPSRWEAYGLVALEARAAGRVLLVSNVDGLRDHASAGATLVRDGSVRGWTAALDGLDTPDMVAIKRARVDASEATHWFAECWERLVETLLKNKETAHAA